MPRGRTGSGPSPSVPVVVLAALAAVCLGIAGAGLVVAWADAGARSTAAREDRGISMDGRMVVADPPATPAATPAPATPPTPPPPPTSTAPTGDRFVASTVGLNIPLKSVPAVNGQITPAGYTSAYWITNLGVAPSKSDAGTVFVVMHSVRGGGVGPGNYLTDVRRGRSALPPGATIDVAGVSFRVTGSRAIPRDGLAGDAAVWAATPRRLVVITCLQQPDGSPSVTNMVIEATRV